MYERRVKQNTYAHVLGTVRFAEYFGLLESLTNTSEQQMPCQLGTACEDDTQLVWFTKEELVRGFRKE